MAQNIERKLLAHIARKYPRPLHEMHAPKPHITERMRKRNAEEKKLFQILSRLPSWGIGRLFTTYDDLRNNAPTFWRLTRVHVDLKSPDMEYGVAWGVKTAEGRNEGYEKELLDANEHIWRLIPKHEEHNYLEYKAQSAETKEVPLYIPLPPLMAELEKQQNPQTASDNMEPMMRLLIKRGVSEKNRQKLADGSLV
uniref:28S ribosomal protein S34, mitochondrial n=1 Tax=Ciona savignyi TaxID=51511 RepID=H2YZY9_CIOSA